MILRYLAILLLISYGIAAQGQVLHTVPAGSSGFHYGVDETPGSLYEWWVEGGEIVTFSNNRIVVDWGTVPGVYELKVVETNIYGCTGDTVYTYVEITEYLDYDPFPDRVEICEGEIYVFDAGEGYVSYLWNDDPDQIGRTFATGEAGTYWVQVVNEDGLIGRDTVELVVNPLPEVDLGDDTVLCPDESILLDAGDDGDIYNWSTGDVTQTVTVFGTDVPTEIWVEVFTNEGCSASDTIFIDLCEIVIELNVPNVFTPNDDGFNDTWIIRDENGQELSVEFPNAVVEVFNRWGERVFVSQPGNPEPWDGRYRGRPLSMDSYHYVIRLNDGSKIEVTGTVTIVR